LRQLALGAALVLIFGGRQIVAQAQPTATAPAQSQSAGAQNDSATKQILVSAAASTKDVLEALDKRFAADTGADVKLNPGPSNVLAEQILAGAPADLFLSANQQWADAVRKGGQAKESLPLLTNKLVIVVPQDNPGGVHEPKDLLSSKVTKVALSGEKVPAGIYAGQALTKLGLLQQLAGAGKIVHGQDVRNTLAFVERGEAEAGIVYSTDVRAAKNVATAYEFDPSLHDKIVYVLVLTKHAGDNAAAASLYKFLQSREADETYKQFGFERLH
jgi:molybdate transport system substrate-binding protein